MHLITVTTRARPAQVLGVVHGHAAGALHQRLEDQRGGARGVLFKMGFERPGTAQRHIARRLARQGTAPVGRRHLAALAQ